MKSKIKGFSERGGKILILLSLALYAPTLTMGIAERIFKLNGYTWHVLLLCLLSFIVAFLIFCKIFNKYIARLESKAKEAQKDSKNRQIYPLGIFYLFIFSLYGLLTMIVNSEAQGWLLIYAFSPFVFAFIIGNILYLQKIKALFLILLFICLSAVCMFAMGYIGYFLHEYMLYL